MKVSFTGPGCSGKSTLLTMCQEHYGDKFTYVTEVTRPIARKGLPINESGGDETQKAIIDAHIHNDKLSNVIMDRCALDGLVYTDWMYDKKNTSILNDSIRYREYYPTIDTLSLSSQGTKLMTNFRN